MTFVVSIYSKERIEMNINKLRVLIKLSSHEDIAKELELTLNYKELGLSESVIGLVDIYSYISHQIETWTTINIPLPEELASSTVFFQTAKTIIEGFIYRHLSNEFYNSEELLICWRQTQKQIDNIRCEGHPFDHPISQSLIELYLSDPSTFKGAYYFLTNKINDRSQIVAFLKGVVQAYEFQNDVNSNIHIVADSGLLIPLDNFSIN